MWLLPTRRRLNGLRRFFRACQEYGCTSPGLVLVNEEEYLELAEEYQAITLPEGWKFRPVRANCLADAVQSQWEEVRNLDWVGLVTDDLVPGTPNWDQILIKQTPPWGFISSNDGWQAPQRMHGACVFGGELLRSIGYLYPRGLKHLFMDDMWETIGRETGCWSCRMDVMVKHMHVSLTGEHDQTELHINSFWAHDKERYETWIRTEKDELIARVNLLMQSHGVSIMRPDFKHLRLMIATPTIDGKYESNYVTSLFATMRLMEQNGAYVEWAEEKYNADVSLARSKVYSAFLRSTCTHLLMIDADMGWGTEAVVRLLGAKKDLVAVAGPKKFYPLKFAANFTDENGNAIQLEYDQQTGTCEVGEVGMAFALLTRDAAIRFARNYPELSYKSLMGEVEYTPFIPMIHKNQYMAEDFAFCVRWRQMGGKVHVCPDVKLSHTGSHTFAGAMADTWREPMAKAAD